MSFTPLTGLHTFMTVARHRNFSAAARELGVSTSAVSQAIRQFEERLGVTLLSRTTRSVAPTEAGRRLLERSGPALEQALDGLRTFTDTGDEITGTVRLSVPELAMEQALNAVVPRYLAAYPKVSLELQVEGRNVDIVKEGYDGGVRMENIPKDMVRVRLSDRMRFVVVGAPRTSRATASPRSRRTCSSTDVWACAWSPRASPTAGTWSGGSAPGASPSCPC